MAAYLWNAQGWWVIFSVCIPFFSSEPYLPSYYMDLMCYEEIDMEDENITSGKLKLTQRSTYEPDMDCWTVIRAPPDFKLVLTFLDMNIAMYLHHQCEDYVELYDGHTNGSLSELQERLCGIDTPSTSIETSYREVSIHFISDDYEEDNGFELLFTSFHEGPCTAGEFECDNGYCIDERLHKDGYNHCGDKWDNTTDSSIITKHIIAGVVVCLIGLGIVFLICRCRRNKSTGGHIFKSKTNNSTIVTTNAPHEQPYPPTPTMLHHTDGNIPPTESVAHRMLPENQTKEYPPSSGTYPPTQDYGPPQDYTDAPPQGYFHSQQYPETVILTQHQEKPPT